MAVLKVQIKLNFGRQMWQNKHKKQPVSASLGASRSDPLRADLFARLRNPLRDVDRLAERKGPEMVRVACEHKKILK